MARLRKFNSYRRIERPNTRVSKYKKKSYVKSNPHKIIVRYHMGNPRRKYTHTLDLVSKIDLQIRQNALESARQSSNRLLEKTIGANEYALSLMVYPHHILRENPLAAGAGADRFSTGMAHSFGKPMGAAAQVRIGQPIFRLEINKEKLNVGLEAMKRCQHKLPCSCLIETKVNQL